MSDLGRIRDTECRKALYLGVSCESIEEQGGEEDKEEDEEEGEVVLRRRGRE